MIDLAIQFKLIIFSFIFGFIFSFTLDVFNPKVKRYSKFLEITFSFLLVLFMSFIYFIGIQKIGNAIFHMYSIMSIIIGFVVYNVLIKIIANNNKK